MKVIKKDVEDCRLSVTLFIDKEEFDSYRKEAYLDRTDHYPVPGVAPGLAELSDLTKIYGPAVLYDEALEIAVPKKFNEFLNAEGLRIFGKPKMSDMEFSEGSGVSFRIEADLFPKVELGQYLNIAVPYVRKEEQQKFEEAVLQKASANMKGEIPPALITQKMNALLAQEKLNIQNDAIYHLLADMLVILDNAYVAAGVKRPMVQVRREAMDLMLQVASAEHEMDWKPFLKEQILLMAERYHSIPEDFPKTIDSIIEKRLASKQKMTPEERTEELFRAYLGSLELSEEQWKNQRSPDAAREVCIDLLLDAVAEKEGITVDSAEFHEAVEELADEYNISPEEVEEGIDSRLFTWKLKRNKALSLILNSAVTDFEAKAALDKNRAEVKAKMEEDVEIKR